eukprot:TRINITY_DN1111_c0_g1_i1.p1 TRINITY_DN1111_c0_g1~~TRINITY_DN1111_c0_g1_i1.p1  ORF type:complete len:326 (+),score=72.70 TRINITY_DN1111_c0_g1_i1:428-1405(+)
MADVMRSMVVVMLAAYAEGLSLTFWNNTYYTTEGNHPSLVTVDLETNESRTIHTQYDPEWSVWEGAALCNGVYVSTYITIADVGFFYVNTETSETKSFPTSPHYYTYACHPTPGFVYASTSWQTPSGDVYGLSVVDISTGVGKSIGNFTGNGNLNWAGFPNNFQFDFKSNTLWGSFPTSDKKGGYLLMLDLATGSQVAHYEYGVSGFQPYEMFPSTAAKGSFTGVMMDPSTMMQRVFYEFTLNNSTKTATPLRKIVSNWMYSWSLPPTICGNTAFAFKNVENLEAPTPHNVVITWDVVTGVQGPSISLKGIIPEKVDGGALVCSA